MNLTEINKLRKKAIKEAHAEVDKIFAKYSKLIEAEIANQILKGEKFVTENGKSSLYDKDGNLISHNSSYVTSLSCKDLLYRDDSIGSFDISNVIEGTL